MRKRGSIVLALLLIGLFAFSSAVSADSGNLVQNGSFEEEFIMGVGKGWTAFNNGGLAGYNYVDDIWGRTVADGQHSQLLVIHTKAVGGSNKDRYTGIYQTVNVVPGARYMFSFYGMARSTEGNEAQSGWGYRIQVGFDDTGGTDPWAVTEWTEMPWGEYPRSSPGPIYSYAHGVTAFSDKLTIFIRGWKKFPSVYQEANFNIDAVSLVGQRPAGSSASTAAVVAPASSPAASPIIPKTGMGDILPIAGIGMAIIAIGLTAQRLFKRVR